jgi:hypothetical protein
MTFTQIQWVGPRATLGAVDASTAVEQAISLTPLLPEAFGPEQSRTGRHCRIGSDVLLVGEAADPSVPEDPGRRDGLTRSRSSRGAQVHSHGQADNAAVHPHQSALVKRTRPAPPRLVATAVQTIEAGPHLPLGVASIAHQWGFTNLGRFAETHTTRYGESPEVTLRRTLFPH